MVVDIIIRIIERAAYQAGKLLESAEGGMEQLRKIAPKPVQLGIDQAQKLLNKLNGLRDAADHIVASGSSSGKKRGGPRPKRRAKR